MINFKLIKWKNFLSYGNEFAEIDLSKSGMTLIVGENGSGKSTLLDALTFALFGKPFRNINKPQLINSINKKDCLVELEFSSGLNNYKIKRGLKPSIFEVYCNDELINQSAEMKDYQEILEKQILKLNLKSFCQVVVLGSASFVPFMQLPAAQRRAIVEDLLDLQVFSTMNILLKDKIIKNNENILENDIQKKIANTKINIIREHLSEIVSKNEQFIENKQLLIKEYSTSLITDTAYIKEKQEIIEELKKNQGDIDKISEKLDQLKVYNLQLISKISLLNNELELLKNHQNCPTCKQEINEQFKCENVNIKNDEVLKLEIGLEKLNITMGKTRELFDKCKQIQKQINVIENEITRINFQVINYKKQIEHLNQEINSVKMEKTESNNDIKLIDLEKDLQVLSKEYNELMEDKQVLVISGLMLKDNGSKTKLINKYIPTINQLINKYLSMMDFFVSFEMNNEFEETIKSRHRDDFSYGSFSEGQKQRIDLAILFTWRAIAKMRNSVSTNILILDEVFDSSLDVAGTEQLMSIIQSIASENSLLVISHKEQMNDKFDNVIKFTMNKNFSKMEIL